tara:strand:- start:103 stop:321 length:219 start_codon:yes stop_codon:yes gene_type:complete
MNFDRHYEDITDTEANFILDIYEAIDALVYNGKPVTLIRLAYELGVSSEELSDYLPTIITILNKVEEQYEVR